MRARRGFLKGLVTISGCIGMNCGLAVASGQDRPTILIYGDSLSAAYGLNVDDGWPALLQQLLAREGLPHQVVNASVSGETTAGGLARLPQALKAHRPQWVVIELGANDGLRGLPVKSMRANLEAMVTLCKRAGARAVLVGMQLPPNFGLDYTRDFAVTFKDIAEREKLPRVPFLLDGVADRRELFLPDNLHPNKAAQPRLLENVWAVLGPLVRGKRSS